jgi:hypothetical protein
MQYISIKDSKVKISAKDPGKATSQQIGELLLKSAQKDVENTQLKQQNADLLLRVARLELT